MRVRLTPAFVAKAKAAEGAERTLYWDEAMAGFGLMVTPGGHKSFVYQYRAGRRSRRMAFKFELGLERARKEVRKAFGLVAGGNDPLADRRKNEASAENALKSIAQEYLTREGGRLRSIAREDAKAAHLARQEA